MNQIIFKRNILQDVLYIDIVLFLLISMILIYGIFIIWSASGQNIDILQQKIIQIVEGLCLLILFARIPPKKYVLYTPYMYFINLVLLILVNFIGHASKGSQRWLDIGIIRFQPSEIAKLSILFMVTYYLNKSNQYPPSVKDTFVILILIIIPTTFIILQPDLGTAVLTCSSGLLVLFLSGISWKLISLLSAIILLMSPIFWYFCMHEYQKSRISNLWHPETDPLGSGYHIIQSKIAIGSGGFNGKGWLCGTQSQLEFLPERHTDFIFSVIGEELGFIGILVLLLLYLSVILRGLVIAIKTQHMFGKLIISSFILMFFMCIIMNISMVSGIFPVVGIPLPLISYGGSSLLVLMAGFGCIMSMYNHRNMISKNI